MKLKKHNKSLDTILETGLDECLYNKSKYGVIDFKIYLNYLKWGCYDCEGHNKECTHYLPVEQLYDNEKYGTSNHNKQKI